MWLTSSSIGRKLVMSLTGAFLILFVTFHALMNGVAILWPAAYNVICEFLGANWYALVGSLVLALGVILHIAYATWLTLQNRKARGNAAYAVDARQPQVEWSSKNMFVLGVVVIAFFAIHLIHFWAKMQLAEITGCLAQDGGASVPPAAGTWFLEITFKQAWVLPVYIIGFIALWFHLTHGFWSMFQTCGWNGKIWMSRLKTIGNVWATAVIALFIAEAVVFTVRANQDYYTTNEELVEQYVEMYAAHDDACVAECQAACDDTKACTEACKDACKGECTEACKGACKDACVAGQCNHECGKAECGRLCCKAVAEETVTETPNE